VLFELSKRVVGEKTKVLEFAVQIPMGHTGQLLKPAALAPKLEKPSNQPELEG